MIGVFCSAREPSWILLERGKSAYREHQLNASLDFFMQALDSTDEYPEAEYWLGKVYEAGGQRDLAEQQYRKALLNSLYLRVPEERFLIMYSLANILLSSDASDQDEAEVLLLEILNSERVVDVAFIEREHRYINTLINRGLDDLLFLYRDELHQSLKAMRILGEYSWRKGRYRSALLYSTRTVLSLLSTAAEQYRAYDSAWRFDIDRIKDAESPDRDIRYPLPVDGVEDLLEKINNHQSHLIDWLFEMGFWRQIYLLSLSLYAEGYAETAEDLWRFLAAQTDSRVALWVNLATAQLEQPFLSENSLEP